MKRSLVFFAAIIIIALSILFKVHATDHKLVDDTNPLTVTVYQNLSTNVQPNTRVRFIIRLELNFVQG